MIKRILARLADSKGFTLVETLVVVTIVGVMASVAVVAVGNTSAKGKESACKSTIATLNTASEAYNAQTGAYPAGSDSATTAVSILVANENVRPGTDLTGVTYEDDGGVFSKTCA
ncbi:MAG TPA: prepilin-type N-terminal cleavage/methylation domain-containing protein [Acidimicrobiales bacterium]|nr:prepilin-type N-terminal cleavage/methylation domain-containing protein [Acidimicrobiales bacterium]